MINDREANEDERGGSRERKGGEVEGGHKRREKVQD